MKYFDRTFFKFLVVFLVLISLSLVVVKYTGAQVIINEVQTSPSADRFVELYNLGLDTIDLTGWYLQRKTATGSDFSSFVSSTNFLGKSIGPGGYFVISRSAISTSNIVLGSITLTDSNALRLKNSSGIEVDSVAWGASNECDFTCPTNPGDGQSIQRVGSTWAVSTSTPGLPNSGTALAPESNATTTESVAATTTSVASSSLSSSSHYSSPNLSVRAPESKSSLSAGRDRVTTVGTPIEFQAEVDNKSPKTTSFEWSFGDGSTDRGVRVVHVYEYAGNYEAVLNAVLPDGLAVSRMKVVVLDSGLSVVSADRNKILIRNNSSHEANLFGRGLFSHNSFFPFPKDTILGAGESVYFSSAITKLKPKSIDEVVLVVVGEVEPAKLTSKLESTKQEMILGISNKIKELEREMALLKSNLAQATPSIDRVGDPLEKREAETATTSQSVEGVRESGWLKNFTNFLLGKKK